MTDELITEAIDVIANLWPENAEAVFNACAKAKKFNGGCDEFLENCIACGGNWSGMLLTGIRQLWPEVYAAIPQRIGNNSFPALCNVLVLCGVDTSN